MTFNPYLGIFELPLQTESGYNPGYLDTHTCDGEDCCGESDDTPNYIYPDNADPVFDYQSDDEGICESESCFESNQNLVNIQNLANNQSLATNRGFIVPPLILNNAYGEPCYEECRSYFSPYY